MNKGDLINKVADDAGITKAQANEAIDSLIEAIGKTLPVTIKFYISGVIGLLIFMSVRKAINRSPHLSSPFCRNPGANSAKYRLYSSSRSVLY